MISITKFKSVLILKNLIISSVLSSVLILGVTGCKPRFPTYEVKYRGSNNEIFTDMITGVLYEYSSSYDFRTISCNNPCWCSSFLSNIQCYNIKENQIKCR